jgi:PAS domain S-box-containing protein
LDSLASCLRSLFRVSAAAGSYATAEPALCLTQTPVLEAAQPHSADKSTERRSALRLPMYIMATLEGDGIGNCEAKVINLSETGMAIRPAVPLESGQVLSFRFGLPGTKAFFEASGQVVWVDTDNRAGIHFLRFPKISRQHLLSAWLRHLAVFSPNSPDMAPERLHSPDSILNSQPGWVSADSIEDYVLIHDDDFRIVKVNRPLQDRLGLELDDVIGQTCESVLPGAHKAWRQCPYCSRELCVFGETQDPCFGGFSMVSTSAYSENGNQPLGTIHIIKDVTNQRNAEQKYRLLFDQAQEGVFVAAPDGRLIDCNNAFAHMLGYGRPEELLALDSNDLYGDPAQHQTLHKELSDRNSVRNYEITFRKKNGARVTVLQTCFVSRDATGNILSYQGFVLDITEKKVAEEELRRRNRELYALNAIAVVSAQSFDLDEILHTSLCHALDFFSAAHAAVYLIDEESKLLSRRAVAGPASTPGDGTSLPLPEDFLENLRTSRTEILTSSFQRTLPVAISGLLMPPGMRSGMWAVLWDKDDVIGFIGIGSSENREFGPSDETLMVSIGRLLASTVEKVRLHNETSRAYDDLQRAQAQLLQSEKMAAVGQLTAGVAHEINNPLTAILGYAQLLQDQELSEGVRDFILKLNKQALRTHKIVQNLLSFSRQQRPQRQLVDVARVLENTLSLREYHLRVSNISVERRVDFPLPPVMIDTNQVEQVILNIVNNAVDAILEAKGRPFLGIRVYEAGSRVIMEFHDSGPGIKDSKHIFDPFYTTKEIGKGTGLGLSICDGIMKQHGGEILAHNHPQGGAVFQLCFPAVTNPAVRTEKRCPETVAISTRLLLLDPDPAVADIERAILLGTGAEVTVVTSGEQAITHLEKETFQALVLDGKAASGLSGMDVYEWVADHRPELTQRTIMTFPALLDGRTRRFISDHRVARLLKPLEIADLIALVHQTAELDCASSGLQSAGMNRLTATPVN